MQEEICSGTF